MKVPLLPCSAKNARSWEAISSDRGARGAGARWHSKWGTRSPSSQSATARGARLGRAPNFHQGPSSSTSHTQSRPPTTSPHPTLVLRPPPHSYRSTFSLRIPSTSLQHRAYIKRRHPTTPPRPTLFAGAPANPASPTTGRLRTSIFQIPDTQQSQQRPTTARHHSPWLRQEPSTPPRPANTPSSSATSFSGRRPKRHTPESAVSTHPYNPRSVATRVVSVAAGKPYSC